MKKILISLLLVIFSNTIVEANNIDFYGEKIEDWGFFDKNIKILKNKIDIFQKNTGLNTDVVILGKNDKQGCYNTLNFDNCIQTKYGYGSDIVIVLKMKSDISSRGDIRSYMENKNYPIITTSLLKNIQDSIIYNFKNNNFEKGIIEYYNKLESNIYKVCKNILNDNKKFGGGLYKVNSNCNIENLLSIYKENETLKTQFQQKQGIKRNIYIFVSFILFIIFMVVMHYFYLGRLNKILNDIKFQLIDLDENKTFEKDLEKTKKDLEKLIKKIEIYLGNADKIWTKLRKYYLEVNKKANQIKFEYDKSVKNFNKQNELKQEIQDFKNINI